MVDIATLLAGVRSGPQAGHGFRLHTPRKCICTWRRQGAWRRAGGLPVAGHAGLWSSPR